MKRISKAKRQHLIRCAEEMALHQAVDRLRSPAIRIELSASVEGFVAAVHHQVVALQDALGATS